MIKNFYSTLDTTIFTLKLTENLIDLALKDFKNYLNNLPPSEQFKYDKFKRYKIFMSTLMLKYSSFKVYDGDTKKDLFNFYFDVPTSKELCENPLIRQYLNKSPLRQINDLSDSAVYFTDTLNLLNTILGDNLHSCYYMLYHKGCEILPHTHSPGIMSLHILLEDIENGEFVVGVNKEEQIITKRGQNFIFDPNIIHYAKFNGDFAKFLMINIPSDVFHLYIKLNHKKIPEIY